jgi:hypothetical protein
MCICCYLCAYRVGCYFKICAVLGYYAAWSGSVPTFRDNISVPFSLTSKMGPICCPETSVQNGHSTLHNTPEEHGSYQHCGGSLKSCIALLCLTMYTSVSNVCNFRTIPGEDSLVKGRNILDRKQTGVISFIATNKNRW